MNIAAFRPLLLLAASALFAAGLNSCWGGKKQKRLLINGAGASFPYILYSKWIAEYRKANPGAAVNYQSIGSGGGIRQFITGTLDFGGTDIPMSKEELASSKKPVLHIPTALGAVALTYNLPFSRKKSLRFDGQTLAKIFTGKIKKWNDPQIQKLNPGLAFPDWDIVPVYRADGSGTTSFFTNYLSDLSPSFAKKVGKGKSAAWPAGVGGKGNEGVMGLVNKIKGSIAYIGLSYAASQNLPTAAVKNKAGRFQKPNLKSIQAAARQAIKSQKNYMRSLINIEGADSYPMAGFTYIVLFKTMPEKKGRALVNFLIWALNEGQQFCGPLHFISLPDNARRSALKKLSQIEFEKI